MDERDMKFLYKLSRQITAKIYAGISMVFLVVYTSLGVYCKLNDNDQWAGIFLALGFGLFAIFFFIASNEMRKGKMGP